MGFVEDHDSGFGKYSDIRRFIGGPLDGQICEEKMMVNDNDIAFERATAHLGNEAAIELRALLPRARI